MQLNIIVVLVGVSIWNERDRIYLSSNSSAVLNDFLRYRTDVLTVEHKNDNAHLVTNQRFDGGVIGKCNRLASFYLL